MPPLLSLVVPCYRVARYLPAFLAALDEQKIPDNSLWEVIFVVDGCPENSEGIIRDWQVRSNLNSQIIVTANRGVSAARNTGIEVASGEWISFPDPDDRLGLEYVSKVIAAIEAHRGVALIATRLTQFSEAKRKVVAHQLDYRYNDGSRELDLELEPDFLQLAVHTALFKKSVIDAHKIRFDPRIKVFEDGKFVAEYLIACGNQRVYVEVDAIYFYTKRADETSALARADKDPLARYRESLRFAHLEMLGLVNGSPPRWLENYVLYDLYWLFSPFLSIRHPMHGAARENLGEVAALSREVLRRISIDAIMEFSVVRVLPEVRAAWLIGSNGTIPERWVYSVRHDKHLKLREYRYFSSSLDFEAPIEIEGQAAYASFAKWREIPILGQVWLYERIIWTADLPNVQFKLNAAATRAGEGLANQGRPRTFAEHDEYFGWTPKPVMVQGGNGSAQAVRKAKNVIWRLASRAWKAMPLKRDAWVFIDRDTKAGDNAEAMYRSVRQLRPDVNAYFVINKSAPDYRRLRREGYRVLPHGSFRHFATMRWARFLISSQVDHYIVRPFEDLGLVKTWGFIFLQHGVTQNSLHRWLNTKDIQMLVTATEAEFEAFVEDPGLYNFTEHEAVLTGFPRHDSLYRKTVAISDRRLLLIMPTWRQYLTVNPVTTAGNTRHIDEDFSASDFVQAWRGLLRDPRILEICDDAGLTPAILPHPNFEPYLDYLDVPEGIKKLSYSTGDVQEVLARAALTMTDYSSQAFEGAFCEAPSVYFQFDREAFFGGGHIASPGYFDYERDGFGPVVVNTDQAIEALKLLADGSHPLQKEYSARIEVLYKYRDDGAARRIIESMVERLGA